MIRCYAKAVFVGLSWVWLALPATGQGWVMEENGSAGEAGAYVCAATDEDQSVPPCLRLACSGDAKLRYEVTLASAASGEFSDEVAVEVRVDGRAVGLLQLSAESAESGVARLTAPFDPRLHRDMIGSLRRGGQAELALPGPDGATLAALSLDGSSKALGAVMDACPVPKVPLNDPAALVLDEIVRECGQLNGSVAMAPGFERREDLDGDGRDDVVIDYSAALCSGLPSLYCGSGGCTTGFFLRREDGFRRIYTGVVHNYAPRPDGLLALDLHGSACGLSGASACQKVFRIDDDSFALVEELTGDAAVQARAADRAEPAAPGDGPGPVAEAPLTGEAEDS